jgi:hypothetical protein
MLVDKHVAAVAVPSVQSVAWSKVWSLNALHTLNSIASVDASCNSSPHTWATTVVRLQQSHRISICLSCHHVHTSLCTDHRAGFGTGVLGMYRRSSHGVSLAAAGHSCCHMPSRRCPMGQCASRRASGSPPCVPMPSASWTVVLVALVLAAISLRCIHPAHSTPVNLSESAVPSARQCQPVDCHLC